MKLTNRIKLRSKIRRNKFLYAFLRLFQHRKDSEYLDMVSLQDAPRIFRRENDILITGKGRIFYIVEYPWRTNGFFAIMRKVLSGCAIADSMGMIPYVHITNSIFNIPGGFNGTDNMFEYYFDRTYQIDYSSIINEENYIKASYSHVLDFHRAFGYFDEDSIYSEYTIDEGFLKYLGTIAHKYIVLKENLRVSIFESIKSVIDENEKTVAVHFRGSDFLTGRHGHPIAGKIEQYFSAIDDALAEGYQKIFLATDDDNALKAFVDKYGNKICFFADVQRSKSETGVHLQTHERENDQYYLGLEVLRDMLAISRCDGIVAGLSQVSIYARIQKYADGNKYDFQRIIDNGLNVNDTKKAKDYYDKLYKSEKVKNSF